MPWVPRTSPEAVAEALNGAESWREVLDKLGYAYHGKNIATIRRWAERWGISTAHLSDNRGPPRRRRYSDDELREAVAASLSWAETLRRLGHCPSGGNWRTLKRIVAELGIDTDHFDPYARSRGSTGRCIPLEQVLVEGSTYSRSCLKRRLYKDGLKERRCELCGQDEQWNGRTIGLILDHINGVRDDNRIENLRIVCPNCAAGLDTHCGRKNRVPAEPRSCRRCGATFMPRYPDHRYCSIHCGTRRTRRTVARPETRKVARPPYEQLMRELAETSFVAVGRKYGVSDNAVRKWVRFYERQRVSDREEES